MTAAVIALSAAADVLFDAVETSGGAPAFMAGHIAAIVLYRRKRRGDDAVVPEVRSGQAVKVAICVLALGVMAATAWTSRFPRYHVGPGAMLFVSSKLLIFRARNRSPAHSYWPCSSPRSFCRQALITKGVMGTLRRSME